MSQSGIPEIIEELNVENGNLYKMAVLKKYSDNELLKRVLKMTYDKTTYTYGIRKVSIVEPPMDLPVKNTLEQALDFMENVLCPRITTGHHAVNLLEGYLNGLDIDDMKLLAKIINRDLRINLGKSQINKVFPDLIVKPPYMRCGIYSEKTASKISFPAIVQLKADGMYQAVTVENGNVTFTSRTGEEREFPSLEEIFSKFPDGVYIGEILVRGLTHRSEANGLLNSDNPPHDDIYMQLWDMISLEEYADAKHQNKSTIRLNYVIRLRNLRSVVEKHSSGRKITIVPTERVENIQEALKVTSEWMNDGYEGSILKDETNIFKDHTSPTQLKLKLEIDIDVRIVGFTEGTKGTKREATFGAMMFSNDEGTIKGQCSGFNDKELEDFNNRRSELIGNVITVQCNDITKGRDNDYYALSHPRFIEIRKDKNETDTLERALELKNMAMMLS